MFKGERALVVGLGRSGLAAARLLRLAGASVTANDSRPAGMLAGPISELEKLKIGIVAGGHPEELFAASTLVVVSPGVPENQPAFEAARRSGARIIGELELASRFIKGRVIAITGTNGKSTTTAFTGHIAAAGGLDAFTGGNLGIPLCEAVLSGRDYGLYVVEVSSFQLDTIETFRPDCALLLNLKPDHMDRYASFGDYARSKRRIFENQGDGDFAVVNADDPEAVKAAAGARSRVLKFSSAGTVEGASVTRAAGGGFVIAWRTGGSGEDYRFANPRLPGAHNAMNAAAAVAACRLTGVPPEAVRSGLESFSGLHHRIELVAEGGGVRWFNDSKATNVDSVDVSLRSFEKKIIWIAGGRHKGAPYTPLRELVRGRVKAALLVGESAELIRGDLGDLVETFMCKTIEAAVRTAAGMAEPGDVVLLSPACASFDQFRNYEERGEVFARLAAAAAGGAA